MGVRSFFRGIGARALEAYDGATRSRNRSEVAFVKSRPVDEDRNIGTYGRSKLRLACADLIRNDPVVSGIVRRFADYVVGPEGLTPQAKTSDEKWNDAAEAFYRERAKIVDYRRRVNHAGLQRQAVIARLYSGDIGFAMLDSNQLQAIEGERINTPRSVVSDKTIVDGVKVSGQGIPLSYYVIERPAGYGGDEKFAQIDAADMIYCASPWRPDSLRPAPELAPVINLSRDYDDLNKALLNKARLDARQAYVVTSEHGAARASGLGARDGTPDSAGKTVKYETFGDMAVHYMNKGEAVTAISGNAPGPYFVEYGRHLERRICACLGLPREFGLLDFNQGSFAQSRAALMMTYRTVFVWQVWLRDTLMQRDWNWSIAKAIKEGKLPPAPIGKDGVSEWYKVQWSFPRHDWIDPQAQVDADLAAYRLGTMTMQEIVAKNSGRDAEDVIRDKARFLRRCAEIAAEEGVNKDDLIDTSTNAQRDLSASAKERAADAKPNQQDAP